MAQHEPVIPGTTAAALLVAIDVMLIVAVVAGAVLAIAALIN